MHDVTHLLIVSTGLLEPFVQQLRDARDPLACAAGLQLLADLLEKARSSPATGRAVGQLAEPAIVQAMHCPDASVQGQALKVILLSSPPCCQGSVHSIVFIHNASLCHARNYPLCLS